MFCKLRKCSGEKRRPAAVIASAAAALAAGVAVALADGGVSAGAGEGGEGASSPWLMVAAVGVPAALLAVLGIVGFVCWRRKQER